MKSEDQKVTYVEEKESSDGMEGKRRTDFGFKMLESSANEEERSRI